MKTPTLVILAAGMGSRYGGLKQIDAVGDNGESIIDFSIYDAIQAGFKKLILIIREEHEEAFEKQLVSKIRPFIDVEYAYQALNDIPDEFSVPQDREKPWGTVHALLAIESIVKDNPFTIMNADDFYGRESFKAMFDFLQNEVSDDNYAMIGYTLKNTLTDHGTVTRGVCQIEEDVLKSIVEIQKIEKSGDKVRLMQDEQWQEIDGNSLVSMNYWGFTSNIFEPMKNLFTKFLKDNLHVNPMKCEYVIPTAIGTLLNQKEINVKVIPSSEQWYGITYQEDKPLVVQKLKEYKEEGIYPPDLWVKDK